MKFCIVETFQDWIVCPTLKSSSDISAVELRSPPVGVVGVVGVASDASAERGAVWGLGRSCGSLWMISWILPDFYH